MRRNRVDLLRTLTTHAYGNGLGFVCACAIVAPAQTLRFAAAYAALSLALEAAQDFNGR